MANYRDAAKERFWRQTFRKWQRSGLTIREFCAVQGLAEHNFHAWRRELAWRDQGAGGKSREPAAFVPVVVRPELVGADSAIEVVLGNGRRVRVGPGFDADTLTLVVTLLEGGRSC